MKAHIGYAFDVHDGPLDTLYEATVRNPSSLYARHFKKALRKLPAYIRHLRRLHTKYVNATAAETMEVYVDSVLETVKQRMNRVPPQATDDYNHWANLVAAHPDDPDYDDVRERLIREHGERKALQMIEHATRKLATGELVDLSAQFRKTCRDVGARTLESRLKRAAR